MLHPYTPPKDNYSVEYIIDRQYDKFIDEFINAGRDIVINAMPITISETSQITKIHYQKYSEQESRIVSSDRTYEEIFLHLCSVEKGRDYNVPCKNKEPYSLCQNQDYTIHLNGKYRNICLYRVCRIHWIAKILQMLKCPDDNNIGLYYNEDTEKLYCLYTQRTKNNIQYYVIIFKQLKYSNRLVTAYPITVLGDVKTIRKYKKIN